MSINVDQKELDRALANMQVIDNFAVKARQTKTAQRKAKMKPKRVPSKVTIASAWCDTFTYMTHIPDRTKKPDPKTGELPMRPWQGFINMSRLLNHHEYLEDPTNRIFQPNVKHQQIIEMDGFPWCKSAPKYINALRACENNAVRMYNQLLQCFRPEAIALLWPELQLRARNMVVRKQNQRELTQHQQEVTKISKEDRQLHGEIVALTKNKSTQSFVRGFREMSR